MGITTEIIIGVVLMIVLLALVILMVVCSFLYRSEFMKAVNSFMDQYKVYISSNKYENSPDITDIVESVKLIYPDITIYVGKGSDWDKITISNNTYSFVVYSRNGRISNCTLRKGKNRIEMNQYCN